MFGGSDKPIMMILLNACHIVYSFLNIMHVLMQILCFSEQASLVTNARAVAQ